MDSELERWYSKFDNISDEHGICMRTDAVFEFQDRFNVRCESSCESSPHRGHRMWSGMEWGMRVRRAASRASEVRLNGIIDFALLLMTPDAMSVLQNVRLECRISLNHNWDEARDIHSELCAVDPAALHRVPLDFAEATVNGNWAHFLDHPNEYLDGEGNLLVTCLLHVDNSQHKQRSLAVYLSETSNIERVSTECKKNIKLREDADRSLVAIAKAAGNALFQRGRYLDAVVKYSEALGTFHGRQTATLWNNRSAAYMKAKMYQEALEDALKARGLKPDWAKVYFRIGASCLQLRRFKLAADSVRMGLDLKPGDIELMCLKMKIQRESSKAEEGTQDCVTDDFDFLLV